MSELPNDCGRLITKFVFSYQALKNKYGPDMGHNVRVGPFTVEYEEGVVAGFSARRVQNPNPEGTICWERWKCGYEDATDHIREIARSERWTK